MNTQQLESVAQQLVVAGKGILAADESHSTIGKRFAGIGIENVESHRRDYREMLFTTPGAGEFISGVILYDETLRQSSAAGVPFVEILAKQGIVPGIKVDLGAKPLAGGAAGETVTEGLDGLRERLVEYRKLGAKFAKWRAVISIGQGMPTAVCLRANAEALARYAALCQENEIVPIVEPEVLMDGEHTIERCFEVTQATLHKVFGALFHHGVHLEGILLKPNMVISATKAPTQAGVDEVARRTLACLRRTVPAAVPGIVFLSGGQSDELATAHLDAMNKLGPHPWALSFSYGRALQQPSLKAWSGKDQARIAGQKAFYHRAKCNGAAARGRYGAELERDVTTPF